MLFCCGSSGGDRVRLLVAVNTVFQNVNMHFEQDSLTQVKSEEWEGASFWILNIPLNLPAHAYRDSSLPDCPGLLCFHEVLCGLVDEKRLRRRTHISLWHTVRNLRYSCQTVAHFL